MGDSYEHVIESNPDIFKELKQSYDAAIEEQGNHGVLIAISMPQEIARKLAYPTASGNRSLRPMWINGKLTVDVVEIAQNFA